MEKFGTQTWTEIAQRLPNRSGKQCRERWHNHLDPGIKKVNIRVDYILNIIDTNFDSNCMA